MSSEPDQSASREVDLRAYLAVLRHRKWSILLITIAVVGVVVTITTRAIPVYTSEARVLVLPTAPSNSPFYFLVTINMDTEAGLVDSEVVGQLVRDNLAMDESVSDLLASLSVSVEGGTEILDIDYTDTDPVRAQKLAQGFGQAYLEFRQQQAAEQIQTQADGIKRQIDRVSADVQTETDPAKVTALQARLGVLQQNLADLQSGGTVQPGGQIVQPALLPTAPSNAGVVQNGVIALIVGLALGVGVAFLRERLDDRLRGREDLETYLGAPVLGVVPKVSSWRNKRSEKVVTLEEPKSASAEAYRTLRTSIMFVASQRPLGVLMVSSPTAGDGKTTTVANLGVVLAEAGKRVTLVSGDLRKPRIHRFFKLSNDRGLAQALGGEQIAGVPQPTATENLSLVAAGGTPVRPTEILQSEAMGELIATLRGRNDFVIIDSAPVLAVADALAMAPIVDGVLFVADAQSTSRQAVSRARAQLEQVGAPVIGAVLNDFDPSKAHGAYSYGYYYRYEYGRRDGAEADASRRSRLRPRARA